MNDILEEKHAYVRQVVPGDELPTPPPIVEDEGIRQQPPDGDGGTGITRVPLEPYAAKISGTWYIYVTDGTFGDNALASGASATPTISGTPISTGGSSRPKVALGGSELVIYLTVSLNDDKEITDDTVNTSNSADPPSSTDSTAYVRIGSISWTDGKPTVTRNLDGSQSYGWCSGHKWAKT